MEKQDDCKVGSMDKSNPLADSPKTKTCTKCKESLPIQWFRFRHKALGTRMSVCRNCRTEGDRARKKARREGFNETQKQQLYASLARARSNRSVVATVDELVNHLGGVSQTAKSLAAYLKAELESPMAVRRRLACGMIAKLMQAADSLRQS